MVANTKIMRHLEPMHPNIPLNDCAKPKMKCANHEKGMLSSNRIAKIF